MKVVIVLGNMLESKSIHPELRGRVEVGLDLFWKEEADYVLFTGGRSNDSVPVAECTAMRKYAVANGLTDEKILLEDESLDTISNAINSRLKIESLEERITQLHVVTSCYHTPRAEFVFNQCFGPAYQIHTDDCYPADPSETPRGEESKIQFSKQFFNNVESGNIAQIITEYENQDHTR